MHLHRLRHIALAGSFMLLASASVQTGSVAAQDATSTAGVGEAIPASECTTAPRPISFLGDLVSTPVSDADDDYVAPTTIPEGTAVDEQTAAEINLAVRQIVACSNSSNVLSALALFGDSYLRRSLDPRHELKPDDANTLVEENLATPVVVKEEDLVRLLSVENVIALPDGRVAAVVTTDGGPADSEGTDVDLFIFVKTDAGWIVDDAIKNIDDVMAGKDS